MDFIKEYLLKLFSVGIDRIDEAIAAGDAHAAEHPEFDTEWQQIRAALVAVQDDPGTREKLEAALAEGIQTFVNRHGEVGPSHGLAGG
jgi:hypothetical protein